MGGRLFAALRAGPRGLRHAPTHAQEVLLLAAGPEPCTDGTGLSRPAVRPCLDYLFLLDRLMRFARSISWRKYFLARTRPNTTAAATTRKIRNSMTRLLSLQQR